MDYVVVNQCSDCLGSGPRHIMYVNWNTASARTGILWLSYVSSIRPGKIGDPTVHDIGVLQYSEARIEFKIEFGDVFMPPPRDTKPQARQSCSRYLAEGHWNRFHAFYDNLHIIMPLYNHVNHIHQWKGVY